MTHGSEESKSNGQLHDTVASIPYSMNVVCNRCLDLRLNPTPKFHNLPSCNPAIHGTNFPFRNSSPDSKRRLGRSSAQTQPSRP